MKRATLLLDDYIYNRAKALSRQQGKTLKEVLNVLLRFALNAMSQQQPRATIRLPLHRQSGPQPGIDIADRSALYDLLDD